MIQDNYTEPVFVEAFNVSPNYISVYKKFESFNENSLETFAQNFRDNFHDLQMSASAVKAIKKAVNIIACLARRRYVALKQREKYYNKQRQKQPSCTGYYKNDITQQARIASNWEKAAKQPTRNKHLCTFVTLTLQSVQEHTDIEITKYLINPFLAYARKYFGVRYYIWKKELQKNGNLHFHFVMDHYIDHNYLRSTWNRICNRGNVKGVKNPFRYVDNYHDKMMQMYGNGFDFKAVKKHFEQSAYTQQAADDARKEFELKHERFITTQEYDKIFNDIVAKQFARAFDVYQAEQKKPASERWKNPNSTDISAVNNPRVIASYVGKYLTKEIDENPEAAKYIREVNDIKTNLRSAYYSLNEHKSAEESTEFDEKMIEFFTTELANKRAECPILGKLWFKSLTLTPFLKGISRPVDDYTMDAVKDADGNFVKDAKGNITYALNPAPSYHALTDELGNKVKAANGIDNIYVMDDYPDYRSEIFKLKAILEQQGVKRGRSLIIRQYEKDANGNDTDNVITTTLLVNSGDLKKLGCPLLSQLWRKFLLDCLDYNRRRGLYEKPDNYFNNYKVA